MAGFPHLTRPKYWKAISRRCCSTARVGERMIPPSCAGLMARQRHRFSKRESFCCLSTRSTRRGILRRMAFSLQTYPYHRRSHIWSLKRPRADKAKMRRCSPCCCRNAGLAGKARISKRGLSALWANAALRRMPHASSHSAYRGCVAAVLADKSRSASAASSPPPIPIALPSAAIAKAKNGLARWDAGCSWMPRRFWHVKNGSRWPMFKALHRARAYCPPRH